MKKMKGDNMETDIRAASSALIREKGTDKYLLEYSRDRDAWQIPGGRLRLNESPYDALIRELWEEISLDRTKIQDLKLVTVDFRYSKEAGDSMMHFFFTFDYDGSLKDEIKPDNFEVNDFGLFTREEMLRKLKDRFAADRVQCALESPQAECIYLENAKPVF